MPVLRGLQLMNNTGIQFAIHQLFFEKTSSGGWADRSCFFILMELALYGPNRPRLFMCCEPDFSGVLLFAVAMMKRGSEVNHCACIQR